MHAMSFILLTSAENGTSLHFMRNITQLTSKSML